MTTNGIFDCVEMNTERKMYTSAYNVIDRMEAWNILRDTDPGDNGFMFSKNPELKKIMKEIADMYVGGHSGLSMGITMRVMQYIAINGYDKYREQYLSSK